MLWFSYKEERMISQIFVFILFAIAAVVAVGLSEKRNMWKWIAAYWTVLTIKNFVEWVIK